ncbi:MAG TPA: YbaY family lipoprotein [Saprospiraceae bacterium]|nr:YbaY family lipoprotein [Saprospiraceae bacterium]
MKYTFVFLLSILLILPACVSNTEEETSESLSTTENINEAAVSPQGLTTLQGTISHQDNGKTIPPSAYVFIQLVDITDGVEKAALVEDYVYQAGQSEIPLPFNIRYDDEIIQPERKYGLQAEIKFTDLSLYYALEPVEVISNGVKRDIDLILAKGPKN